jgi:hypothetical protein
MESDHTKYMLESFAERIRRITLIDRRPHT